MARSCATALAGQEGAAFTSRADTPLPQTRQGVATDVAAVVSETFDVIIELCPTGAAASHISLNFLIELFFGFCCFRLLCSQNEINA